MKCRPGHCALALAAVLAMSALPAQAQRRGETMKVTAADDRKAQVTPTDEGFVRGASSAYEAGSSLAMLGAVRASDAATKAYGQGMVKEMIELGSTLKPAASGEKGYQWASQPEPADAKIAAALERVSGHEFDREWVRQVVALRERMVAVFSTEAEKGRDPDLKPLAARWLPRLREEVAKTRQLGQRAGR